MNESKRNRDRAEPRFGTFGGVFTPCTLTILGVIMFLRFGYVVGQAGIWHSLVIVGIAKVITLLTSLSLSAIATNTHVQGGGAYYLISRSLGNEFGGAIGIVFFLAQAIASAMYVIGFSEVLVATLPGDLPVKWIATVVNIGVFICVFIGAGWTIRVQYFILAALGAALVSFFVGAIGEFDGSNLRHNWSPQYGAGEGFATMFALFFPAVTGIMAGANMSGDLKDPARSIPRGTLAAVAVTAVVYLSQAVLLGCARPSGELTTDPLILKSIAVVPALILVGVFAATLSSALSSMMGAPRVLQAFARDDIFHWLRPLGMGSGRNGEPRRAIVLTFVISQCCVMLADLNAIAPIITMAFMITYGLINFATFCEAIARNPSYRPQFRFSHWSTSLLGAVACLAVMILIDWVWALVSMGAMLGLYWYISRAEIASRWGDVQRGLLFERARHNLVRLEEEPVHPKNWRPVILALSGVGWSRPHLAAFGHWFTAGRGILSLGQVIHGEVEDRLERRVSQERLLRKFIREYDLEGFPAVVVAPDLFDGIEYLVQCHGLGAMRPNTVLLGWPDDSDRAAQFAAMLRTLAGLECSVVTLRLGDEPDDPWHAPRGTIDVWWRGKGNGALMLLLAHLLTQNKDWRGRSIRLLRVISHADAEDEVKRSLAELIDTSRIRATPVVFAGDDVQQIIQQESRAAAVVFLGFNDPEEDEEIDFFEHMESLAGDLNRVVFVRSVGGMSLES